MTHHQHKSICPHCGGSVEFSAEVIWTEAPCPHCRKNIQLGYTSLKRRQLMGSVLPLVGVCLLFIGLAMTLAFFKPRSAQTAPAPAAVKPAAASPESLEILNDFQISQLQLEKNQNNSLVYATGTARSLTSRQRFSVKIELDLLDQQGEKVGTASDYLPILEPEKEWRFKALVTENCALVKVASIRETH